MTEDKKLCIYCKNRSVCRLNETFGTRDFYNFFFDNLTSNFAEICIRYEKVD